MPIRLRRDKVTTVCAAVVADCACEGLRRAARAVSKVYTRALAGVGLTATQLAILVATRLHGSLPLSRLAQGLHLDRTSLYRAVRPLERNGLLGLGAGRTQRERVATVTVRGERVLQEALPIWESTQRRFVDALGPRAWTALSSGARQAVAVARSLEAGTRAHGRPRTQRPSTRL
jgi:DNA-binding MarR family transcriptional regulator